MEPRIEILRKKKLVGKSVRMSLENNRTSELWKDFMSCKASIKNVLGTDRYSVQIYDAVLNFKEFKTQTEFTKYAMVETSDFIDVPKDMETYVLVGGLYAVFVHKGMAMHFPKTAQYIFSKWLPNSDYVLDQRAHFEVLDSNYNPMNENAEEEVWIPIRLKKEPKE